MKKTIAFLVLLLGISLVFGQNATDQAVTLQVNYDECSPEYGLTVSTDQWTDGIDEWGNPMPQQNNTLEFNVAVDNDAGNITTLGDAPTGNFNLGISYSIACSNTDQELTVSMTNELDGISIRGQDYMNAAAPFNISTSAVSLASGLQSSGYVNLNLYAELLPGASIASTDSQTSKLIVTMINDN